MSATSWVSSFVLAVGVIAGCQGSAQESSPDRDAGLDAEAYDLGQLSDAELAFDDSTCAAQSQAVGLLPLDMLIAIDTSYSMDFDNKWVAVKQAIKDFVGRSDLAGLGVGIQFFPLRRQCSVEDYAEPAVPIGELPGVEPAIVASLDSKRMFGGTPMVPMIAGVLGYARQWAVGHPDRKVVVILATDGIPDDTCLSPPEGELPNTIENVVALATDGANESPVVPTFIIGVGTELGALNDISRAGNGADAILVDTAMNIQQAFLAALNAIRRRALACDYPIPEPMEGTKIDFSRVNVTFTAAGQAEQFFNVADQAGCAKVPTSGWYYDTPVAPKKLVLCPETCDRVLSSADGALDVEFGCATIIK